MSSLNFSKSIREGNALFPSLNFQPVSFHNKYLKILDQTLLPNRIVYRKLKDYQAVAQAIKTLQVRGAPLIGVTAAFGLAVETNNCNQPGKACLNHLRQVAKVIKQARPTAVNLAWAIDRCMSKAEMVPIARIKTAVINEAKEIYQEETERSFAMGRIGAKLVKKNAKIVTICNAGILAAPGLGTALAVIYTAFGQKKNPSVYIPETRPLLQGARLTAFELTQAGIESILITDSTVGSIADKIDLFLVGADRIAANGDAANKIGTLAMAIIAHHFKKPFYVVAPTSTFDLSKPNGKSIPVEKRKEIEVKTVCGCRIAPEKTRAYNPAFDITPGKFITGFITDKAIIYPPYKKYLKKYLR